MRTKKLILTLILSLVLTMAMGVAVYAGSNDKNQQVSYLYVRDINYNRVNETKTIKGITYDAKSNTLTLNNCNYVYDDDDSFITYHGEIPLKVVVKGENNITAGEHKPEGYDHSSWYESDFIIAFNDEGGDSSILISGDGTLNLNNFSIIVNRGILNDEVRGFTSVDGVTINTNGAGFNTWYGDITIRNASIKIKDVENKANEHAIEAGRNNSDVKDPDGNGTVTIQNSTVEISKIGSKSELIVCNKLNIAGEYLYAGKTKAEYQYSFNDIFSKGWRDLYYCDEEIQYVLITTQKKNYPKYVSKNNPTTGGNKNEVTVKPPKKVSLKSVKNVKGKKAILKWKKLSKVKGYEIQYALNKKFTKKKKTTTAKGASKTIKKLKKKKTYFFRIRAYKVSGGSRVYGKWSQVKKVKIKK